MDKSFAKRYLIYLGALFLGSAVITSVVVAAMYFSGRISASADVGAVAWLCVACVFVPACSFNGFCVLLRRVRDVSGRRGLLFVAMVLPVTIAAVPVGAVTLVPMVVKTVKNLLKK